MAINATQVNRVYNKFLTHHEAFLVSAGCWLIQLLNALLAWIIGNNNGLNYCFSKVCYVGLYALTPHELPKTRANIYVKVTITIFIKFFLTIPYPGFFQPSRTVLFVSRFRVSRRRASHTTRARHTHPPTHTRNTHTHAQHTHAQHTHAHTHTDTHIHHNILHMDGKSSTEPNAPSHRFNGRKVPSEVRSSQVEVRQIIESIP